MALACHSGPLIIFPFFDTTYSITDLVFTSCPVDTSMAVNTVPDAL